MLQWKIVYKEFSFLNYIGSHMGYRPDITIRDSDHNLVAIIEVKAIQKLHPDQARDVHRDYMNSLARTSASFFILVLQDVGFLWVESELREDGKPNFDFDMEEVFKDYFDPPDSIKSSRGETLEYAVFRWLLDMRENNRRRKTQTDEILVKSGFVNAIQDADISFGMAA